jgi:hypothetical protein
MNKKKKTAAVSESLVPTPQRLISNVTVEILNNKVDFLSNTNQPNSANTDESMPNFENEGPATTSTDAAVMTNMALSSSSNPSQLSNARPLSLPLLVSAQSFLSTTSGFTHALMVNRASSSTFAPAERTKTVVLDHSRSSSTFALAEPTKT